MDARSLKSKNNFDMAASNDMLDEYSSDDGTYDENNDSDDTKSEHQSISSEVKAKRFNTSYRDVSVFRKISTSTSSLDGKGKPIERMPTRRPNPKICNRNAVMARENRRKKKEYLETLQRDVDQFQSENKKLKKMLNARNTMISKLTHESMYLKSILANKTEIMKLLKTIQGSTVPITSSALSFVTGDAVDRGDIKREHRSESYTSSSGCSPASSFSPSPYTEDEKENGMEWVDQLFMLPHNDPFMPATLIDEHSLFTDFESHLDFPQTFDNDLQWESLLNQSSDMKHIDHSFHIPDIRDIDDSEILSTNGSHNVNHEHNYFNNPVKPNKVTDEHTPGVCLHVSSGRVSLEFCSSCHLNSQNAWIEEM